MSFEVTLMTRFSFFFIKSLASMTGDLSSMTAPPFILSPTSLTEFPGSLTSAKASVDSPADQYLDFLS